MKNTRFSEMLSAVNSTSVKRFTELVCSPYFNKNTRLTRLWRWITVNQREDNNYSEEELLNAIEPDESSQTKISPANFRMVISDFVRLAEVFLLLEGGDIIEAQRSELIDILKEKGLSKSYNKHLRLLKEQTASAGNKDVSYYNNLYFIECEEIVMDAQKNKGQRLAAINKLTDLVWISMKLDSFTKSCLLGEDVSKLTFYGEIMALIEKNSTDYRKNHKGIFSRWLILKMFMEPDDINYFKELEKYTAKIKERSIQIYNYDAMLTYCSKKGDHKKGYELVKLLERKNLIANENGQVDPARLEMIVNLALASGRMAEAERWKMYY